MFGAVAAPAAGAHGRDRAAEGAAESSGDDVPVVDPFAVAQDIAKEDAKLERASFPQRAYAQRFQYRFAVGFPHRRHDTAMFALLVGDQAAQLLRDVPAVQKPKRLRELSLPHSLEALVAIAGEPRPGT